MHSPHIGSPAHSKRRQSARPPLVFLSPATCSWPRSSRRKPRSTGSSGSPCPSASPRHDAAPRPATELRVVGDPLRADCCAGLPLHHRRGLCGLAAAIRLLSDQWVSLRVSLTVDLAVPDWKGMQPPRQRPHRRPLRKHRRRRRHPRLRHLDAPSKRDLYRVSHPRSGRQRLRLPDAPERLPTRDGDRRYCEP